MTKFNRSKHKSNFTVVDNDFVQDGELSWQARGMLTFMLSCSDDWEFSVEGLAKMSKNGVSSTRNILRELEAHNHVKRERVRDSNGRVALCKYTIYEVPEDFVKPEPKESHTFSNGDGRIDVFR